MTFVGHAFMHSPQRMHIARNSFSGRLPGWRTGNGCRPAPHNLFTAREEIPAAEEMMNPRRDTRTGAGAGFLSDSSTRQRKVKSIAPAGQTPPQVWQNVQSRARELKSSFIASNGQIARHLSHYAHVLLTFLSMSLNRFIKEKTAPVGQRYLHQNRLRSSPSDKTRMNRAAEKMWAAARGGTMYQPRETPITRGVKMCCIARVISGIGAKKPANITPHAELTSRPASR